MRFLSDDGKVFNTVDECKEYEDKQKKANKEEEIRLERVKEMRKVYVRLLSEINDWLDNYHDYLEEYPEQRKAKKGSESCFELNDFLNFLIRDFTEVINDDDKRK